MQTRPPGLMKWPGLMMVRPKRWEQRGEAEGTRNAAWDLKARLQDSMPRREGKLPFPARSTLSQDPGHEATVEILGITEILLRQPRRLIGQPPEAVLSIQHRVRHGRRFNGRRPRGAPGLFFRGDFLSWPWPAPNGIHDISTAFPVKECAPKNIGFWQTVAMARILQTHVSALFPESGPVRAMLYGEAPGPLGADKSGVPFWGDRAGRAVYGLLQAEGLATVPTGAFEDWDGARLKARGWWPVLRGVALGNAFPVCPTRDGDHFRAPTDAELKSPENIERLGQELSNALSRCEGPLRVIAMGRRSAWILSRLKASFAFELEELPHPSAQGLLQAAPDKGRGLKLADLRAAWEARLGDLLR